MTEIKINIDMENQKIEKVDSGGLNPIAAASVLLGVASGLLATVKVEVKPKSGLVTPSNSIVKPTIKVIKK